MTTYDFCEPILGEQPVGGFPYVVEIKIDSIHAAFMACPDVVIEYASTCSGGVGFLLKTSELPSYFSNATTLYNAYVGFTKADEALMFKLHHSGELADGTLF